MTELSQHRLAHPLFAKKADMNRYRLTFDANPKELARRDSAGTHIALLWSRRQHRAAVVVEEDSTGELLELDVHDRENPLQLYQHPYAYLGTRGHPGKPIDSQGLREAQEDAHNFHRPKPEQPRR